MSGALIFCAIGTASPLLFTRLSKNVLNCQVFRINAMTGELLGVCIDY
jgi:hypothetical protein